MIDGRFDSADKSLTCTVKFYCTGTNGWNPEVLIRSVARVMELFNSPVQRRINFALPLFLFDLFGLHTELFKLSNVTLRND